jgi:hypothetical protein
MANTAQDHSATAALIAVSELSEEAVAVAQPELHPREFVSLLLEKELYPDAVRFLAHALPKREGVWWAWMCARRSAGENPAPAIGAALQAAEKWIAQPTEEHRRAAMEAAEAAKFSTAAGCAALAAFLSGGSMAPPTAPPAPPGEYMTAKAVAGSVTVAAVAKEPEKAPEKYRMFVTQALDVATRIKLWEK